MSNCPHEKAEPVTVQTVWPTVEPEIVAKVCVACLERLPAAWGCQDCEWVEGHRRAMDYRPRLILARPCSKHWRNA